ncbi:MAG: hypothetical protein DRH26_00455 [Deltaproteobacteria bacterium]|nr:MAG: hypothetical protein DRH26_00455 [Deltaproteobacteria bacterium]
MAPRTPSTRRKKAKTDVIIGRKDGKGNISFPQKKKKSSQQMAEDNKDKHNARKLGGILRQQARERKAALADT